MKIICTIFAIFTLLSSPARAILKCSEALEKSNLVLQTDPRLTHRYTCSGLCGISSLVNTLQILRVEHGLQPISDPQNLINTVNEKFVESRLSTLAVLDKMIGWVSTEIEKIRLPEVSHSILALPYPVYVQSQNIEYTTDFSLNTLQSRSDEKKILALVIFGESDDSHLASHTVSLVDYDADSNIAIISDPNIPELPLKFTAQRRVLEDDEGVGIQLIPTEDQLLPNYYYDESKGSKILVNYIANIGFVD